MINNRVVKGGFKTSALLMLALTGCQTVNTNPSAPSERVPYVQLPIFIGSNPTTNSLQSYDWQLNNINSTDPITWNGSYLQTQNGKVTLNFNQNHITYNVGCNQLSNQYSLSKNIMQPIGTGISTFIGKLFVANRPRLVNRAFTIKIKADGLVGHFFNVITVVDFVI